MSTHAAVFVYDGYPNLKGSYIHFDGYPNGVGAALLRIVQRDGLKMASKVLVEDYKAWLSVTGERSQVEIDDEGKFFTNTFNGEVGDVVDYGDLSCPFVIGYGKLDPYGGMTPQTPDSMPFCDWAYLLDKSGLYFAQHPNSGGNICWLGKVEWKTRPEDLNDFVKLEMSLAD